VDLSKIKDKKIIILPVALLLGIFLIFFTGVIKSCTDKKDVVSVVSQDKQAIEVLKESMKVTTEDIKKLNENIATSEKRLASINKKLKIAELSYAEIKKPVSVQETIDILKSYGYHPYLRGECDEKNK